MSLRGTPQIGVIQMSLGARFILNSQYKHIARPGEPLSKHTWTKSHIKDLIEYTATRETVVLNFDNEKGTEPATQKQNDKIEEFVRKAGLNNKKGAEQLNNLPQYLDYKAEPTKQTASELISYLAEQILINEGFDETSNLIEYTAKRPGVVKVGEHGLFSAETNCDLEKEKESFSSQKGNIFTHILSIRREDADRLGYDSQKPWRDLILSKLDVIASAHGINVSDMHWVAAMHNTGNHPHVHFYMYADDKAQKRPHLDKNGIKKMKSAFASDIFRGERMNLYKEKDLFREELNNQSKQLLNALLQNPLEHFDNDKLNELVSKINQLSRDISNHGQKDYQYMPKDIKEKVNDIQRRLVNDNKILSSLYQQYCDCQYNIEKIYVTNPPKQAPIDKVEAFKPIKNEILKRAFDLRDGVMIDDVNDFSVISQSEIKLDNQNIQSSLTVESELESSDDFQNISNIGSIDSESESFNTESETETISDSYKNNPHRKHPGYRQLSQQHSFLKGYDFKGDYSQKTFSALKTLAEDFNLRNGEICRELADKYYYGNGCLKDTNTAVMWYGIAADQFKDSYANYRLGQIYYNGTNEIEVDAERGEYYSKTAYLLFQQEIENSEFFSELAEGKDNLDYYTKVSADDAYKEYLIGRLFLKGHGMEQDYYKAYCSFSLASTNGYNHADYYIGNMYYYGLGFEQSYENAIQYYEKSANKGDYYASHRLGRMYQQGEGVDINLKNSEMYYKHALKNVVTANYDLARLYELHTEIFNKTEENIYQLYKTALRGFEKQEEDMHDTFTEIRLGNMYLNGQGTEQDINKAVEWLNKAAEQNNPDALYQLGYIYSSEEYSIADTEKAFEYYARALENYIEAEKENENATAEYRIGRMYFNGMGIEENVSEAVKWLEKAALNHNATAAYQLYKIYSDGNLIEADFEKASAFLKMACLLENPYAQYTLGNIELENGNIERGIKLLNESADKEMSFACYKLGGIYSSDEYGLLDETASQEWYSKALNLFKSDYKDRPNDITSCRLGNMYLNGQGTEQDVNKAVEWLNKAAKQNNPDALYQLGYIYGSEEYSIADTELSQNYYQKSLAIYKTSFDETPDGKAAYRIGTFYHYGLGVERSIDEAVSWYLKAVELGNIKAQEKLDRINDNKNQASLMVIATTAAHLGRMIDTETHAAFKQRYASDSKILRQEKIQKINLGQAIDDRAQSFDY